MNNKTTLEVAFDLKGKDEDYKDILMSFLLDFGFDDFWEDNEILKAYILQSKYSDTELTKFLLSHFDSNMPEFAVSKFADIDWNEEWEKNYTPVAIDDKIYVYAPFHKKEDSFQFKILIEPKMSFGTAKHQTTASILRLLYDTDLKDKTIIDAGTGTGILAIFASMKGAKSVFAYDNDIWSVNNAFENLKYNNISNVSIAQGEAEILDGKHCDIFIANIHKNIIISEMPKYVETINVGGKLFLSGFYIDDLDDVKNECLKNGMAFDKFLESDKWTAAVFIKK